MALAEPMTSINQKMGFKPAGKRSMMKLPADKNERIALTAAQCPDCGQRGVIENKIHGRMMRACGWCGNVWER